MKEENGSEGGEIEGGTNEWMNGWRDRRDEGRLHFPHSRRPYGRSSWIMRDLMMLFGAIGRAPATKVITMHEGKSWEYRLLQGGVAGSILAIIPKDLRYRYSKCENNKNDVSTCSNFSRSHFIIICICTFWLGTYL